MKIAEIELYHVEVPLRHTFWPTWIPGYPQTHNRFKAGQVRHRPLVISPVRTGSKESKRISLTVFMFSQSIL